MNERVGVAQAARRAMKQGAWLRALLVTLRLKDAALLRQVILGTPPQDVSPLCLCCSMRTGLPS